MLFKYIYIVKIKSIEGVVNKAEKFLPRLSKRKDRYTYTYTKMRGKAKYI